MMVWWNFKQAGDLPPDVVERMWRALAEIAECAEVKHPAHVGFMSKDDIARVARAALPSDNDAPRA